MNDATDTQDPQFCAFPTDKDPDICAKLCTDRLLPTLVELVRLFVPDNTSREKTDRSLPSLVEDLTDTEFAKMEFPSEEQDPETHKLLERDTVLASRAHAEAENVLETTTPPNAEQDEPNPAVPYSERPLPS
jgi:hypothetical protein